LGKGSVQALFETQSVDKKAESSILVGDRNADCSDAGDGGLVVHDHDLPGGAGVVPALTNYTNASCPNRLRTAG
jgi:hypothetical protein